MSKRTLGQLTDDFHLKREEKRKLAEQIKGIDEELEKLEMAIIEAADEIGLTAGKGSLASFTVSESVVPQVEDYDEFYKYIHRNKYYHLLERRPSVTGCRELFETKGSIPGVKPFKRRRVNLRSI